MKHSNPPKHFATAKDGSLILNYCTVIIDSKHMKKTFKERVIPDGNVIFNEVVVFIDGKEKIFSLDIFKSKLGF